MSIPIKSILAYQCFQNGLLVYKSSREHGYLFAMKEAQQIEISGLCIGYLAHEAASQQQI